jgi:hypothetical protein
MEKIHVIINNDDDSMFGAEGPDNFNVAETLNIFNQKVAALLRAKLPYVEPEFRYGPVLRKSIVVETDDSNLESELTDKILFIVDEAFNEGDFWVEND